MSRFKIYGISISICAVFVSFLINSSYAQSDNFKTYTNNVLNFTVQYPADWKVEETDYKKVHGGEVEFTSPVEASKENLFEPTFTVSVNDVPVHTSQYLDTDTMTLKNITTNTNPKKYAESVLGTAKWSDEITGGTTYKLIRSHEFTVDGKPGWKIEYILGNYYHLKVFTFVNDKVYELWHRVYTLDAPNTFPIANKMVESFKILK